jgi:hypothetical protein
MVVVEDHQQREPSMGDITTIGLDLAKNVFQIHTIDKAGNVVVRKRLRRGKVLAFFAGIPSCIVGLEACATAHYWAREFAPSHEARLMPPSYVKAYVKRNKHDLAGAEAICEAVKRPSMRFVSLKTVEQQSALMMHRARDLLIRQRTMLVNALRGHLAELVLSWYQPEPGGKFSATTECVRICNRRRDRGGDDRPDPGDGGQTLADGFVLVSAFRALQCLFEYLRSGGRLPSEADGRVENGRGSLGPMADAPFPILAHRTGRADLRHPALRLVSP